MLLLLASCRQPDKEIAWLMEQVETVLEQNPDSALHYLNVIQNPIRLNTKQHARYHLLRIQAKDKAGKDISEDTVICEVKDYFLREEDFEKATLAAFYEGLVFSTKQDNQYALQAFLEAENIAEHITDQKRKGLIQHNIGGLYYATGTNYEEAIARLKKATGYFQTSNYYKYAIASFNLLGTCFLIQEQADSALFYQQQGLDMAIAHADTAAWAAALQNISVTYRKMGYKQQAKSNALKATGLSKTNKEAISALLNLSYIYYDYAQYDSAAFYVRRIERLYERDSLPLPASLHELSANIAKQGRRFETALNYYEKYTQRISEINKEERERSIAGIREQYDLTEVQNENRRLQILHLHWQLRAMIGLIVLAVIAGFLFYWNWRHKNNLKKGKEERTKLYDQRVDIYKRLILLEQGLKKTEKETHAGIFRQIKQTVFNTDDEHLWKLIYTNVNDRYHGLLEQVRQRFPELDNTEFKIACLTCAGFNNHDMATFLLRSIYTIKTKKVSLRKKLGIEPMGNIAEFITGKLAREVHKGYIFKIKRYIFKSSVHLNTNGYKF